ncbi:uncharacterized protein TA04100 [Theileria annulata]|uniref:Uncharacterized protein n=1 Tax=Theileria annulata TaxID=5874 RepID=Q4UC84_THEAN|nr:uncharacterized protein TA04100 [Theileria annulata]CAI75567.1 hypothetical protein, conserved [Theileria annulata]|eukprot:XP_955043.1 hypothetical protein, conserved [Theileria annulata]
MLACCVSYSVFTSYDAKSKKKTFLVTYSALFLKLCPKVVKLLHLFNFCQLFAIIFDLLILPECNSNKLRYLFGKSDILKTLQLSHSQSTGWWPFGVLCYAKGYSYPPLCMTQQLIKKATLLVLGFV